MNWNFPQTSKGSFSAVSTPILQVNSKYSFESSWRDLQDFFRTLELQSENQEKRLHIFATLRIKNIG